jgi:7-carboxy-7-deazaguanine synthase
MTARHPPAATSATPATTQAARLRVNEIFYSLQGESRTVGLPTVFIRLTGCPLRCGYCDTEYAFHEGEWTTVPEILVQVAAYQPRYVTVTGGEPLAQRPCIELLAGLCDAGYEVSLETSGALDIGQVDARVCLVMDVKTPGSGEVTKNDAANLARLKKTDQVKFVICDRADYVWSREFLKRERLAGRCEVLFSPAWGRVEPKDLAEWVLADRLPVRVQVQLHKLLWGETRGH